MTDLYKPPSIPARIDISHELPYDPTCGYELDSLKAVEPPKNPPEDFAVFWRLTYEQARAQEEALNVDFKLIPSPSRIARTYEVSFRSWDGFRTGAWLVEPADEKPRGLMVHGHGYSGIETFDFAWTRRGFAVLFVCARGFQRSAGAGLPSNAGAHVVYGIRSRETYILRACVAEIWHGATVLLQRYPAAAHHLVYFGSSFGGGLGALMLPWDSRFKRAFLGVPTFGHHPLRLKFQRGGSGQSLREYWQAHPDVEAVLPYYDASTAAGYIRIPVLVEVALFDPDVCPPGQWAVANAIRSPGARVQVIPCAHYEAPPGLISRRDQAAIGRNVVSFLSPD